MSNKQTDVRRRIDERMRIVGIDNYTDLSKRLAKKMNKKEVPSSNIHNWCNRNSVPVSYVFAVAAVLHCSPEWLMNGENKYTKLSTEKARGQITIPIFREQGESMDEIAQADNLTVNQKWFCDMTGLDYRESYRLMKSSSDSMSPTINKGDMVLIDTNEKSGGDGLFCIKQGPRMQVKRIAFAGDKIHLLSDNARYSPQTASASEIEIIGEVKYIFNGKRA